MFGNKKDNQNKIVCLESVGRGLWINHNAIHGYHKLAKVGEVNLYSLFVCIARFVLLSI